MSDCILTIACSTQQDITRWWEDLGEMLHSRWEANLRQEIVQTGVRVGLETRLGISIAFTYHLTCLDDCLVAEEVVRLRIRPCGWHHECSVRDRVDDGDNLLERRGWKHHAEPPKADSGGRNVGIESDSDRPP